MTCYLCNGTKLEIIRDTLRYSIKRNILKCSDCGVVYLEPKAEDLQAYYDEEYRKLYSPVIGKAMSSQELFDIYLPYQKEKADQIRHLLKPGTSVLDVGCATGHFLYAIKDLVGCLTGIEFNKDNAEFAEKNLPVNTVVFTEPIEKTGLMTKTFDLITLWQVLEHIADPLPFLTTLKEYLKPDGHVVIEVPNIEDSLLSYHQIEAYADFWFREPHQFYYSPSTLALLIKRAGFKGDIKTTQQYGIANHMNWILMGMPQKNVDAGMKRPKWAKEVDKHYKKLLMRYGIGENILFIGDKTLGGE